MLKVFFEIDSREYNDRWFTNLKAWKVEELSSGQELKGTGNVLDIEKEDFPPFGENTNDDGLPF